MKQKQSGLSPFMLMFFAFDAVVAAIAIGYLGMRTNAVDVRIEDAPAIVGQSAVLSVRAMAPARGLVDVTVTIEGAGLPAPVVVAELHHAATLLERMYPGHPDATPVDWRQTIMIGKKHQAALAEGKLHVVARAVGLSALRAGGTAEATHDVQVDLSPPSLAIQSTGISHVDPMQGGSEVVLYTTDADVKRSGVVAGTDASGVWEARGFVIPGRAPTERFAIFGMPYNDDTGTARVFAEDAVGNRIEVPFVHQFKPKPMGKDTIQLNEAFMQKVTAEIFPRTQGLARSGDLLQDYLTLNGKLRDDNSQFLRELSLRSEPRFMWSAVFAPMGNTAVKGAFADHRTYMYQDKPVDEADHLGFDLASVERAPVPAANDGKVMYADFLGIFGNCVIVDHGYGIMSLYAHLSSIDVKVEEVITRNQPVGKTGKTGLAGGDHLHFTMLVHGLPVTPVEWWDAHWIQDRVKLKLGDALPFGAAATTKD